VFLSLDHGLASSGLGHAPRWNDKATGTPDMDRYVAFMKGQLKELLTGYGPIGFSGSTAMGKTVDPRAGRGPLQLCSRPAAEDHHQQPCRQRARRHGSMDQGKERIGDYGTPEQQIPATGFGPGVDWESCMTMNNHWGYNKNDQNWKSTPR